MKNLKLTKFETWLKKVDQAVDAMTGFSVRDLPDQNFTGMYDDQYSPQDAAREILENEGFPL